MLSAVDWLALFGHFLLLSLLSIGGAITVVPDMHRVLVSQMGLLDDAQFASSIAIAQASPGPNVLFVAVMGYQAAGLAGAFATLAGIMLPSTTLALMVARWGHTRREWLAVRAFKAGMAPLVIGLMLASFALRRSSPKRATSERAIAELVTVIHSILPALKSAAISASGSVVSALR